MENLFSFLLLALAIGSMIKKRKRKKEQADINDLFAEEEAEKADIKSLFADEDAEESAARKSPRSRSHRDMVAEQREKARLYRERQAAAEKAAEHAARPAMAEEERPWKRQTLPDVTSAAPSRAAASARAGKTAAQAPLSVPAREEASPVAVAVSAPAAAAAVPVRQSTPGASSPLCPMLHRDALVQGVIMAEVLGPCKAKQQMLQQKRG